VRSPVAPLKPPAHRNPLRVYNWRPRRPCARKSPLPLRTPWPGPACPVMLNTLQTSFAPDPGHYALGVAPSRGIDRCPALVLGRTTVLVTCGRSCRRPMAAVWPAAVSATPPGSAGPEIDAARCGLDGCCRRSPPRAKLTTQERDPPLATGRATANEAESRDDRKVSSSNDLTPAPSARRCRAPTLSARSTEKRPSCCWATQPLGVVLARMNRCFGGHPKAFLAPCERGRQATALSLTLPVNSCQKKKDRPIGLLTALRQQHSVVVVDSSRLRGGDRADACLAAGRPVRAPTRRGADPVERDPQAGPSAIQNPTAASRFELCCCRRHPPVLHEREALSPGPRRRPERQRSASARRPRAFRRRVGKSICHALIRETLCYRSGPSAPRPSSRQA